MFQKNLRMAFSAILLIIGMTSGTPAFAGTVTVDVVEDGYCAMGSSWYMDRAYAKAYEFSTSGYDSTGYIKFDIETDLAGLTSDMIVSASVVLYLTPQQGAGLSAVAAGTTSNFALNAYSAEYTTGSLYEAGTITYEYTATGTYEWITIDITDMVKAWLDGTYDNYGIGISKPGYDGYSWYWSTMEAGSTAPYLVVNTAATPVPGAFLLLGCGLTALAGVRRRKQSDC